MAYALVRPEKTIIGTFAEVYHFGDTEEALKARATVEADQGELRKILKCHGYAGTKTFKGDDFTWILCEAEE